MKESLSDTNTLRKSLQTTSASICNLKTSVLSNLQLASQFALSFSLSINYGQEKVILSDHLFEALQDI